MNQRTFAIEVVSTLRERGYEAVFAGGCVRDEILGRTPKDFDVATSATPDQVQALFRRTIAIGESFGVISILGPNHIQIEVATFRKDADYSDGRRPDHVTFCDAEEDAKRRDFTMNGLFFDPIEKRVIDYVGGQADIESKTIRAIGNPQHRFDEDRLRILRAVRFATEIGFEIEPETMAAIQAAPESIASVSAERITAELQRLFCAARADEGLRLLLDSRLMPHVLPECAWSVDDAAAPEFQLSQSALKQLDPKSFASALAIVLRHRFIADESATPKALVRKVCRRLKTNLTDEKLATAMLQHESLIRQADERPWSQVQPVLAATSNSQEASLIVEYCRAVAVAESTPESQDEQLRGVAFCLDKLQLPASELDPAPLLTGDDLHAKQIPPGRVYAKALSAARTAQLDGRIATPDEAWQIAKEVISKQPNDKTPPSE